MPAADSICIAAVMKQEQPYIVEWVAWHRLLGFDIMIADNGGNDGQSELLLNLANAGLISYIDARMFTRAPQVLAYYAMFRLARRTGVRYVGFLDADEFFEPLLKVAGKGELLPIDGVLVRDWDPDNRRLSPGVQLGMRRYAIEGISFVRVQFGYHH